MVGLPKYNQHDKTTSLEWWRTLKRPVICANTNSNHWHSTTLSPSGTGLWTLAMKRFFTKSWAALTLARSCNHCWPLSTIATPWWGLQQQFREHTTRALFNHALAWLKHIRRDKPLLGYVWNLKTKIVFSPTQEWKLWAYANSNFCPPRTLSHFKSNFELNHLNSNACHNHRFPGRVLRRPPKCYSTQWENGFHCEEGQQLQ